jgi:hypothetical protein
VTVHPILWPASTTISSSFPPQTYAIPSYVWWSINLERKLTGLAAVVVVMPLLIVGERLADAANQAKPNAIRVSGPPYHIFPAATPVIAHHNGSAPSAALIR